MSFQQWDDTSQGGISLYGKDYLQGLQADATLKLEDMQADCGRLKSKLEDTQADCTL